MTAKTAKNSNRSLKNKNLEKKRRDQLSQLFAKLAKLLPCYDPSVNLVKVTILEKTVEYITKLKTRFDEHLTENAESNVQCAEIKELQTRISNLTDRNEQLANLLKEANITIPSEYGVPQVITKPKKWSGKITPEKADEINKIELQKENEGGVKKKTKSCKVRKKKGAGKVIIQNQVIFKKKTVTPATVPSLPNTSNLTITNIQPVQPYYIIANNITPAISSQAPTVVKNVISAPILSTTNQPNKTFTNGIILPVVQPPTLLNPPLILNAAPTSNTLIVVKTNKTEQAPIKLVDSESCIDGATKKIVKKRLPLLKPKRRPLNKLPKNDKVAIPASRYENSFILWPAPSQPIVKKRTRIAKKRPKKTDGKKNVKKAKLQKCDSVESETVEKKASSDYSIDAICKENDNKDVNTSRRCDKNCDTNDKENCEKKVNERQEDVSITTATTTPSIIETSVCLEKQVNSDKITEKPKQFECNGTSLDQTKSVNKFQNSLLSQCHESGQSIANQNENQVQENAVCKSQLNKPMTHSQSSSENQIKSTVVTQQHNQQQMGQNHTNPNSNQLNLKQGNLQKQHNSIHTDLSRNLEQHQQVINRQPNQQDLQIHSELSNDIFASLQVQGSQNPESTSPTAAFLNAFPLVSSFTGVKVTEVMEDENNDSPHGTPTLLQIGTLDANHKPNLNSNADNLTPSIMNLDNFNFFNSNLYNNFDSMAVTTAATSGTSSSVTTAKSTKESSLNKPGKSLFESGNMEHVGPNNDMKNFRVLNAPPEKTRQAKVSTNNSSQNKQFYASASQQQPIVYDSGPINNNRTMIPTNNSNRYNEYNTFNPFELPKTTQSFVKSYNDSAYTNSNCNYNYQPSEHNYQLCKNYYESNNCNFYNTNNASVTSGNSNTVPNPAQNKKASKEVANKSMVNWMAPEFSTVPPTLAKPNSYTDFNQSNYLNANSLYSGEYQAPPVSGLPAPAIDSHQEHQFPWSPTKLPQLLDPGHNFPPSTLPTLVGDLALGGIGTYSTTNQLCDKKAKPKKHTPQYEANFLSVSQLVEPNKDTVNASQSSRIAHRRNSGNRTISKLTQAKLPTKRPNAKDKEKPKYDLDWGDAKRNKNVITNYSAESLIGAKQQNNYPKTIPPYLPDNILPYFPPNIDDNFVQTNQNNQSTTFASNYNNTFMPPPPTSSTYLPTTNFMPDMFENPIENIFSHSNPVKNINISAGTKKCQQRTKEIQCPPVLANTNGLNIQATKSKSKKKDTFVDLSFLSLPSMNSPLLPDDYHANFLAPPPPPPSNTANQLYSSCKNPLYKQNVGADLSGMLPLPTGSTTSSGLGRTNSIQHNELAPASSSLTNFNLCAIFPEMNRANNAVPDVFRNYGNNSTTHKNVNYLPHLE